MGPHSSLRYSEVDRLAEPYAVQSFLHGLEIKVPTILHTVQNFLHRVRKVFVRKVKGYGQCLRPPYSKAVRKGLLKSFKEMS